MIALFLSPVYLLVNIYILRWLMRWMGACHHHFKKKWVRTLIITMYMLVSFSLVIAFVCPPGKLQRILKFISNYWLGAMIYIVLVVIIVDVIRLILKRSRRVDQAKLASRRTFVLNGTFCIILIFSVCLYGALNARHIRVTNYDVAIDKKAGELTSLNIVLAADLHLGYSVGTAQMKQMVQKSMHRILILLLLPEISLTMNMKHWTIRKNLFASWRAFKVHMALMHAMEIMISRSQSWLALLFTPKGRKSVIPVWTNFWLPLISVSCVMRQ